ncbi:hypothetical protein [Streptomyces sp. NPDC097619]|uniref:hypothetical protein n=1 Tax=Streptomyces sp. NPDC097619 TaxID=3157228 RepID=UPI0033206DC7
MGRREKRQRNDRKRQQQERRRPDWGVPVGLLLLATSAGWRHSVLTANGSVCGRLDIPADTDPHEARAAATRMVTELAREFHDTTVEVTWEAPTEPDAWTARITAIRDADTPASPGCEGAVP